MGDMKMRSLFRVTYYDGDKQIQEDVVASAVGEAAAHLGISQWIAVSTPCHNVEVVGVDKPHARIEPKQPNILPLYAARFSPGEVERLAAHFSPTEMAHMWTKLNPAEIAQLREKSRHTPEEVAELKSQLKTKPHRYTYRHA